MARENSLTIYQERLTSAAKRVRALKGFVIHLYVLPAGISVKMEHPYQSYPLIVSWLDIVERVDNPLMTAIDQLVKSPSPSSGSRGAGK